MQPKSIGLVLAGGGAKGAFQVGAIKALQQFEFFHNIKYFSGVSVGALNCVLLMHGYDVLEANWQSLSAFDILDPNRNLKISSDKTPEIIDTGDNFLLKITKSVGRTFQQGVFSRDKMEKMIDDVAAEDMSFFSGGKELFIAATSLPDDNWQILPQTEYFNLFENCEYSFDDMKKLLLASSAIPFVFPPENFNGKKYIDGGALSTTTNNFIGDNFPVKPLVGKCDFIIGIDMEKSPKRRDRNRKNCDLYISTDAEIMKDPMMTLNFSKSKYYDMVELGYNAAIESVKMLAEENILID